MTKNDDKLDWWLWWTPLGALLALMIYSHSASTGGSSAWSVMAVGAMAAGAALLAGGFLGFLFGLPRTLQQTGTTALIETNTNLEQVSDWLTKIIVGLGLVELGRVVDGVDGVGDSLAPALGGGPGVKAFAIALMIYAAVDGFLIGYLWTRIVLTDRFLRAAKKLAERVDAATQILNLPVPQEPPGQPEAPLA